MLLRSRHGREMLCVLNGYGTGVPYCQFFELDRDGYRAYLLTKGATLLVCGEQSPSQGALEELELFSIALAPFRIEGTPALVEAMSPRGYQRLARYVFETRGGGVSGDFDHVEIRKDPALDDVYAILSEGFPNLARYDMWLADTSHMTRRGLRTCLVYKGVTTASVLYDIGGEVLIGQVATRTAARGKGCARDFLRFLASALEDAGRRGVLYALDIRKSFYEEIGFRLAARETVLEQHGEDMDKGAL